MAAVPVGYEAFQSKRRKGVTLLCFILASTMIMGMSVYIDSYSIHEWENVTNVSDGALHIEGTNVQNYIDEIRDMPSITAAAVMTGGYVDFKPIGNMSNNQWSGAAWGLDQSFFDAFPYYYTIKGRFPDNTSEVAMKEREAEWIGVGIGDYVNFSTERSRVWRLLHIVGLYRSNTSEPDEYYYYEEGMAIVVPDLIVPDRYLTQIIADVDRSPISPFDVSSSLNYLLAIDQQIRELSPTRNIYSRNMLLEAVFTYTFWQMAARYTQMTRAGGVALVVFLVGILAIRYNVNDRRYERSMLLARGATRGDVEKSVTREVFILALGSTILGLGTGIIFSRIAISMDGYLIFNLEKLMTEPLLVSIESLVLSLAVGIILPMLALLGYRNLESTKESIEVGGGKIGKLSKAMKILRWDILTIILTILLLVGLSSAGSGIRYIPGMSILFSLIPFALFVAVGSLTIKALRRGATRISKVLSPAFGRISSSVGVRRIGKEASSAGIVIVILVLAISMSWTSAILDVSIPETEMRHNSFGIGADVTFRLSNEASEYWDSFEQNVSDHELTVETTIVSELRLDVGYQNSENFIAITPEEYLNVGYDYTGARLNDSVRGDLLRDMVLQPGGVVITSDIAEEYELAVGDQLRSFTQTSTELLTISFTVLGIVEAIPEFILVPQEYSGWYYFYHAGQSKIWANREYLMSKIEIPAYSDHYLCVSTTEDANTTQLFLDIFASGGAYVIDGNGWTSASMLLESYTGSVQYQMDRSVDAMMTFALIGTVFGAFIIYATEGVRTRKREMALLRSIGAMRGVIINIQIVEMFVITLISLILVTGFSPLFISNTILTANWSYSYSTIIYPVQTFAVIPWGMLLLVLFLFVASIMAFIAIAAIVGSRIKLSESLNASWAEANPYGGDV
ncbi:MAG: FtsX-like permease family protein [Candidatus Thorarchaeota archaeon]